MTPAADASHDALCPICKALAALLDRWLVMRITLDGMPDPEHVLAGVGVWWVTQTLARFDGDPAPMFLCLQNICMEKGILMQARPREPTDG